jgi:hypothetical protein
MQYCVKCKVKTIGLGHYNRRSHRRNVCRKCRFVNYDEHEFTRHLNTHRAVKSITFHSCNKCNIENPTSEHFQTRSYNQNICWDCGFETYDENEFRYHIYIHSTYIMTIECTKCEFYTNDEQELYNHLKSHRIYTIDDFTVDTNAQCNQYMVE